MEKYNITFGAGNDAYNENNKSVVQNDILDLLEQAKNKDCVQINNKDDVTGYSFIISDEKEKTRCLINIALEQNTDFKIISRLNQIYKSTLTTNNKTGSYKVHNVNKKKLRNESFGVFAVSLVVGTVLLAASYVGYKTSSDNQKENYSISSPKEITPLDKANIHLAEIQQGLEDGTIIESRDANGNIIYIEASQKTM